MKRFGLTAMLVVAALLLGATSAGAYVIDGRAWPRESIRYYVEASDYSATVDRAATVWNQADVGIRFARKSARSRAEVVIRRGPWRCGGGANVGYQRRRTAIVLLGPCSRSLLRLVAVHELGHILGLGHERQVCARMNPTYNGSGTPNRCRRRSLDYWLENPLVPDDIDGARALYEE